MKLYVYGKTEKVALKKREDLIKKLNKRVGVGVTNKGVKDSGCVLPDYRFQAFVEYSVMAGSGSGK